MRDLHVHERHECRVVDAVLNRHGDSRQGREKLGFHGIAVHQPRLFTPRQLKTRATDNAHDDSLDQRIRMVPTGLGLPQSKCDTDGQDGVNDHGAVELAVSCRMELK